jgi:membrane protein
LRGGTVKGSGVSGIFLEAGDRVLAYFRSALGWKELANRTVKETMADDGLGLAAQLAYYFFLALFPALLFLLALASFFPLQQFTDDLASTLGRFAAPELVGVIQQQMAQIAQGAHGGLLSVGLLGALWSSSAALVAIISALNRAYDIEESRPWWKVRLIAIGLTVGVAIFILVSATLVLAGPTIADALASRIGLGEAFEWTWKILQWPIAFALASTGIGLVYYFAPDADQDWVWVTPGSVIATALWFVASVGFRFYVVSFGNYQETYGALGGVIVLMLWFYLTGLAIIVGAEMNAEIEHASPWGKEPGEKVPGERRRIGAAAARAWNERPRDEAPKLLPPGRPTVVRPRRPTIGERAAAFLIWLVWPRIRS